LISCQVIKNNYFLLVFYFYFYGNHFKVLACLCLFFLIQLPVMRPNLLVLRFETFLVWNFHFLVERFEPILDSRDWFGYQFRKQGKSLLLWVWFSILNCWKVSAFKIPASLNNLNFGETYLSMHKSDIRLKFDN